MNDTPPRGRPMIMRECDENIREMIMPAKVVASRVEYARHLGIKLKYLDPISLCRWLDIEIDLRFGPGADQEWALQCLRNLGIDQEFLDKNKIVDMEDLSEHVWGQKCCLSWERID